MKRRFGGWRGCVACYRSCGGELNRLPRAYFAGDTAECAWVVQCVHARFPEAPIYLAGMSLGGNYVAKYAGDMGESIPSYVRAIAAVGAPLDLVAGSEIVSHGANRALCQDVPQHAAGKGGEEDPDFR